MRLIKIISIAAFLFPIGLSGAFAAALNLPEPVTLGPGIEYDPAISPDGKLLAYCSNAGGNEDIWIMNLSNNTRWKMTDHTAADYSPGFVGNDKIAFVSRRESGGGAIYISNIDGSDIKKIIGGQGYFDRPACSPDKKWIAYVHADRGESPRLMIYNSKTKHQLPGPAGIAPIFSRSGDSLIFIADRYNRNSFSTLAVYNLKDSSVTYPDTGPGVDAEPCYDPAGKKVIFIKYPGDTNNDGTITTLDDPVLMIYDLSANTKRIIYPGLRFFDISVSSNGAIYAEKDDGNIFRLSVNGVMNEEWDDNRNMVSFDSLVFHAESFDDSIMAAAVGYDIFLLTGSENLETLIKSAEIYTGLKMYHLAGYLLDAANIEQPSADNYKVDLEKGKLAFKEMKERSLHKAWYDIYRLCRHYQRNPDIPPDLAKEACLFGMEACFAAAKYAEGDSLAADGLQRFADDTLFSARVRRWNLMYTLASYAGDPADLTPLFIEYSDSYSEYPFLCDSAAIDLISRTRRYDTDMSITALGNIRSEGISSRPIVIRSLIEQASRLRAAGRNSLAELIYQEILEEFTDIPQLRYEVFVELGDISLAAGRIVPARAYLDSAAAYLGTVNDYGKVGRFKRNYASLYAFLGQNSIDSNSVRAEQLFRISLKYYSDNYYALWGLAESMARQKKWDRWNNADELLPSNVQKEYFAALKYITAFEFNHDRKDLRSARVHLLSAIEIDPRYPPPYLSIGYVDCLLENLQKKPGKYFEESIELSLQGMAAAKGSRYLESGFYINLAEANYGLEQYEDSYYYFIRALESDSTASADMLFAGHLAETAFQLDSLKQSLRYFSELYDRALSQADESSRASHALKLGTICYLSGEHDKSIEYYSIAEPYYLSIGELTTVANIYKARALGFRAIGEYRHAAELARKSLDLLTKTKRIKSPYDNRVKFIVWPFGWEIPLLSMPPLTFGGSIYPRGLTAPAEDAFLYSLMDRTFDQSGAIDLLIKEIDLLDKGGERYNTADLWNRLGFLYFEIGYTVSAQVAFEKAYLIARDLEYYAVAYTAMVNRATALFSSLTLAPDDISIESITGFQKDASDLYDNILPSYPVARANIKGLVGAAEFVLGLLELNESKTEIGGDIAEWFDHVDGFSSKIAARFENSGFYYNEALAQLVPGEYPRLESALMIDKAVSFLALGDFESADRSLEQAVRLASISESGLLFAEATGLHGLILETDGADKYGKLQDAMAVFQDMPPGIRFLAEMPLIAGFSNKAFNMSAVSELPMKSLFDHELFKKYNIVNRSRLYIPEKGRNNLAGAYLRQLLINEKELFDLLAVKRKLLALGIIGQVELKKQNELISKKRLAYFDLKQKIRKSDPFLISTLFPELSFGAVSPPAIPPDELFLSAKYTSRGITIWAGDSAGTEMSEITAPQEILKTELLKKIESYGTITIAEIGGPGDSLESMIRGQFPDMTVKRSYSVDEAYSRRDAGRAFSNRVAIIRFKGYVVTDEQAAMISADIITPDTIGGIMEAGTYGWLVFDGEFIKNKINPNLSGWELISREVLSNSESRYCVHNIDDSRFQAAGAILLNSPISGEAADWALAIKALTDSGIGTVITVSADSGRQNPIPMLKMFFELSREKRPIESFKLLKETGYSGLRYFGRDGWSLNSSGDMAEKWQRERIFLANQASLTRNWDLAIENYILILEYLRENNIMRKGGNDILNRLISVCRKAGIYQKELNSRGDDLLRFAEESGDTVTLAGIYLDLSAEFVESGDYGKAIDFSSSGIELSSSRENSALESKGKLIRAETYLRTGQYNKAKDDISAVILSAAALGNDEGKFKAMALLGEYYNNTGEYLPAREKLKAAFRYFQSKGDTPDALRCRYHLADNYLKAGQFARAGGIVREIIGNREVYADAVLLLGRIMLCQGDLDSAYAVALEGLRIIKAGGGGGDLSKAHELLGDLNSLKGDNQGAGEQYALAGKYKSESTDEAGLDLLLYKSTITSVSDRQAEEIPLLLEVEHRMNSQFTGDLCGYRLGLAYLSSGDNKTARQYFEKTLNSENYDTKRYLGWRALYNLAFLTDSRSEVEFLVRADSMVREIIPEPDYILPLYGLDISQADIDNALGKIALNKGETMAALDFYERGFAEKTAAGYFSLGLFDDLELSMLDTLNGRRPKAEGFSGKSDRYKVLWGIPEISADDLKKNMGPTDGLIRFYQVGSKTVAFYIDPDTVFCLQYDLDSSALERGRKEIPGLLRYQSRADSILELWYSDLVAGFDDLIGKKENIYLVPDGTLWYFPLETLKMPDGDYLCEIYSVARLTHLQAKIPKDSFRPIYPGNGPGTYNIWNDNLELIEYIAETVGEGPEKNKDRAFFTPNAYNQYIYGQGFDQGLVVCETDPVRANRRSDMPLSALMARRDGYLGFIQTLWTIPDQGISYYYWKFLNGLYSGKGLNASNRDGSSLLFGKYKGLPYYWGFSASINLN